MDRRQGFTRGQLHWILLGLAATAVVALLASGGFDRVSSVKAEAAGLGKQQAMRNDLLEESRFIQIPGPNPLLKRGGKGAWDEYIIEGSDAFKDFGVYYYYYHGVGKNKNRWSGRWRLGVATATNPLGPFTKYETNPILEPGPPGSWDEKSVACAEVMKVGLDKYYMWYCGGGSTPAQPWSIGLATASSPLGPWKKYEGNPVIPDFGYVGGVVNVNGKFYLYAEHPIGSTGPDYGPFALAVADRPEGPWTKWPNNPIIRQGGWGSWDDGGFSEAEVVYREGVFHLFYGGAKLYSPRKLTRESIGYAYSFDGINWTKYGRNPVATREAVPNAAAFAEVHSIFEPPFIYLYHTFRYKKLAPADEADYPEVEDLGMQVLAMQTPFRLDMRALTLPTLGPKATSSLDDTFPISLSTVSHVALTAECSYDKSSKAGLRVHVRASYDGLNYDTVDLLSFENDFRPGELARKTVELDPKVKFIKVQVENLDRDQGVSDVKITATLGS
jgi:hypothetical protein